MGRRGASRSEDRRPLEVRPDRALEVLARVPRLVRASERDWLRVVLGLMITIVRAGRDPLAVQPGDLVEVREDELPVVATGCASIPKASPPWFRQVGGANTWAWTPF